MAGQLHIIQAFTNSLSASNTLEKVCCELVNKTKEFFGAVDVAVYLYTDKSQELVRTAFTKSGANNFHVPHPAKVLMPEEGFVGMVFKKGKPELRIPKAKHQRNILERKSDYSEMAVPIVYGGKPIGVVKVSSTQRDVLSNEGMLFLSVLCSIAATVIIKTIASTRLNQTEINLVRTKNRKEQNEQKFEEIKGRMDEILYSLSHEFRGPVLTTMSLIDRMAQDPKRFGEYHPMLKTTVNRLDSILLNIYYYSNNLREPVYTNAVIPERVIKEMVIFLKREFKTEFDVRIKSNGEGYIITDENRFKVILRSLLINAMQYGHSSNEKSAIDIDLHYASDSCKISIQDHGPGMPKSMRKKANSIFNRGTSSSKGAGIGIFVCKELARKIGARINWISEEGKGTRVEIEIRNEDH
ncbi:MAG: ATP-binding protein [Bacteroidota bacterium]